MPISKPRLAFKILCFLVLVFALNSLMTILLFDIQNLRGKLFADDFYQQDRMDMVFLGNSLVRCAIDPDHIDGPLNLSSFNCGTNDQKMLDSYFLLREVFRLYKPRVVMLLINPPRLSYGLTRNEVNSNMLINYMPWSIVRLEYLVAANDINHYPDALIPNYLRRDKLEINSQIPQTVATWYAYHLGTPQERKKILPQWLHHNRGFVMEHDEVRPGHVPMPKTQDFFVPASANAATMEYFYKIVDLCRQNSAELIIFSTPRHASQVLAQPGYQNFLDLTNRLAAENNLLYLNFDLIRPEYLPRDDHMYTDGRHINRHLSGPFSDLCASLLQEYFQTGRLDHDKYFYPTFEAFYNDYPQIAATTVTLDGHEVTAGVVKGPVEAEYRFSVAKRPDSRRIPFNYTVFREYAADPRADLPPLEDGIYRLQVEARQPGSQEPFEQAGHNDIAITRGQVKEIPKP